METSGCMELIDDTVEQPEITITTAIKTDKICDNLIMPFLLPDNISLNKKPTSPQGNGFLV